MNQVTLIDKEFIFDGRVIISQTDHNGLITYANRMFCEVSGYKPDELIGQSHSIIRHPSMPKNLFEKMWNNILSGHIWNGVVKNVRKDGLYYWVYTEILPIKDKNDKITGYIASRKAASRKNIEDAQSLYSKMYTDQK